MEKTEKKSLEEQIGRMKESRLKSMARKQVEKRMVELGVGKKGRNVSADKGFSLKKVDVSTIDTADERRGVD